jgi:tRNA (guanine37-N1)-methyltransferase
MKFKILTLFPEMFESFLNSSIIKRAIANNLISVELINIRDYTKDKYHRVDTPPIGGGAGLIMKCQPIYDALQSNITKNSYKIILAPRGYKYDQKKAEMLSKKKEIVILCGHYEGVDERVYKYFDEAISIGDFVLTGGETAAFCLIDSISRLIKGVISENSTKEESFTCNLLEYPQYTEPSEFLGDRVPRILFSGNHTAINKYRKKKSFILTKIYRPDLFANYQLTIKDLELLAEIESGEIPEWEMNAIIKGMKYTKDR